MVTLLLVQTVLVFGGCDVPLMESDHYRIPEVCEFAWEVAERFDAIADDMGCDWIAVPSGYQSANHERNP